MTTALQIIERAIRLASGTTPGEAIDSGEAEAARVVLNSMLKAWGAEGLIKPYRTLENFSLTPGTPSYSIGSGATFNTARPDEVTGAFIRSSSSTDTPVEVLPGSGRYNEVFNKSETGTPEVLYYDPQYPNGMVYLWPTGNTGDVLWLESRKPFNEFSALSTSLSLPGEYEEHIVFQLALRLAPEYGFTLSEETVKLMRDAEDRLIRMHPRPIQSQMDPALVQPRPFDINSG